MSNIIHLQGDCREVLKTLPDESVQCCITSPPYFGLRDYGTAKWEGGSKECDHITGRSTRTLNEVSDKQITNQGSLRNETKQICPKCGAKRVDLQIGMEETPDEYVDALVEVFREVKRVLRKDGTFWLNLGDSYAQHKGHTTGNRKGNENDQRNVKGIDDSTGNRKTVWYDLDPYSVGLKPKDMVGIPWMTAFALRKDGWYLRAEVIWNKPNAMPMSVTDRPNISHEHLFLFAKSARYYYDSEAVKEPCQSGPSDIKKMIEKKDRIDAKHFHVDPGVLAAANPSTNIGKKRGVGDPTGRNLRSVWTIATVPYKGAHFATFPHKLVETPILASTSEKGCCPICGKPWKREVKRNVLNKVLHDGEWESDAQDKGIIGTEGRNGRLRFGLDHKTLLEKSPGYITTGWKQDCECEAKDPVPCVVLDPFGGSGTTGEVSKNLGRDCILIELNPEYVELQKHRISEHKNICDHKYESDKEPNNCDVVLDAEPYTEPWEKWIIDV